MAQEILKDVKTPSISLFSKSLSEDDVSRSTPHHLIFFITGNPGLITYYTTFLNSLNDLLSPSLKTQSASLRIYGQSLAGFSDSDSPISSTPYSLEQQIQISLASLESLRILSGPRKSQPFDSVILIGHSVGSYILLELLRRSSLKIRAGILLFPTVTHIAQSPSGIKITRLFRIPDFPRRAALAAKAWLYLIPKGALRWLVGLVTQMPADAAGVTAGFLESRIGVWQALHMARDEMKTITEDRWGADIWGIEESEPDLKQPSAKLIFYFGQNDHWVADHTRDALIASRARTETDSTDSKPVMFKDQDNVPHGFCIKHSEIMAEKAKVWIEDILWGQ